MKNLRGLYALTPEALLRDPQRLPAALAAAIRGGAALIQYRDKWSAPAERLPRARQIVALCHAAGARLIVNDDAELAAACGADGVHLGQSDGSLAAARARLGTAAIIGASCSDSLERARAAITAGADYVAFGRLFPSNTKPDAPPAQLATLSAARREFAPHIAICAIGGITPALAPQPIAAGADLVAAVEGVFGAGFTDAQIEAAARAYVDRFHEPARGIP